MSVTTNQKLNMQMMECGAVFGGALVLPQVTIANYHIAPKGHMCTNKLQMSRICFVNYDI